MGFYDKYILPHIINCGCGTKAMQRQRQKIVPQASGEVLEIGIGSGLNLPFYDPRQVSRVIGLDPSESSWKLAAERVAKIEIPVEFIGLPGEQIPLPDDSVDTVLVTYALCTIADPGQALLEMRRVLRPTGKLLFCEHGKAADVSVQRWQNRINGIWRRIGGGCNLNRDIPKILAQAGFEVNWLEQMYLPKSPRIVSYNYWGSALGAKQA